MRKLVTPFLSGLLLAVILIGCQSNGPARDEARKLAYEAAVAVAVDRFIDGDEDRAARVSMVADAMDLVLEEGITLNTLTAKLNEQMELDGYDPATAELARAAVALASLELADYVGGTDIPLSSEATGYAKRMLAAAKRASLRYLV